MRIRKVKKSELRDMGKLMLREFSKPPFNESVGIDDVLESLVFYYKNAEIYVADEDGIIGAVVFRVEQWWKGKVLVILDLSVESGLENDANKDLMEFLEGYCCENDILKIYFETNRRSSSVNVYEKMGYKINKSRVAMEKRL